VQVTCRVAIVLGFANSIPAIVMPPRARKSSPAYQPKRREATARPAAIPLRGRRLSRGGGPLYKQLLAILRHSIVDSLAPVGTPLPREADLAKTFKVSLITVRQALRDLETEGLIRKRAAKPAVVTDPKVRQNPTFDFRTFGDIAAFARYTKLEVVSYGKARARIATTYFELSPHTQVYVLRGVLLSGNRPEAEITTYFPPDIGERLSSGSFEGALIYRSVEKRLGIRMETAQLTVRAETADGHLARKLEYEVGGPILTMELRFRSDDGRPAELTVARHRADLFSLSYDVPNEAIRRAGKG
jgi:GntR family transcriptional regulator